MSTIPQVTAAQLAADITGARVIDVREADEAAAGTIADSTIADSTNIPLGQLPDRLGDLDRSTPIVTVCQSGRRSQRAAEALAGAGFTVADLDGGLNRWLSDGRPTT
jgi:rhodanese-related sulfurtransferase